MKVKRAFTIIETVLAMTFLSILLVSIAFVIIHVSNIYQKGLTIRTITSVGQEIIDDFSRAINSAPVKDLKSFCGNYVGLPIAGDLCHQDNAYLYIYHQNYTNVAINGEEPRDIPTSGAFCSGRYSYVWNTGYVLGDYGNTKQDKEILQGKKATFTYKTPDGEDKTTDEKVENFRLLRIRDDQGMVCRNHAEKDQYKASSSNQYHIDNTLLEPPVELIEPSEYNVALYDMVIFRPTQHSLTLHSLYSGTFILGTIDGGVDITANGDYCKDAPDGLNTDFNYCMINKFNFAMRATGELTDEEKWEQKHYEE